MDILYKKDTFYIKKADKSHINDIYNLICGIAEYEQMLQDVINTPELIEEWLFEKGAAETYIGFEDDKVVGFIILLHNYSSFIGRAGLYIEDIFIIPEKRGKGYGKAMLYFAADLAVKRKCGRMEWVCLNWNNPAIKFYESIGAIPLKEWTTYRLDENAIKKLADNLK